MLFNDIFSIAVSVDFVLFLKPITEFVFVSYVINFMVFFADCTEN